MRLPSVPVAAGEDGVRGFVHNGGMNGERATDLCACFLKGLEFGAFAGGELCKVPREQVLVFLGVVTPSVECVRVGQEEQSAVGEGEGEGERGSGRKGDLPAHT